MDYPFPTKSPFSQAEAVKRFGVVTVEQDPDPAIHFKLIMPLQWGQVKGVRRLVTPQHPFELRAHFKSLAAPVAEAKVSIAYVAEEMSPSDWLALYLEQHGEKVVHERHLPSAGGDVPDVLTVGSQSGQGEQVSRWLVLKDHAKIGGAHFFVLQVSTAASNYNADMANVFFAVIGGFDLLHPTGWAYAEQLRTLVRVVPAQLTTAYPISWQQVENPLSNDNFYQVQLTKQMGGHQVGRISVAVAANQTAADAERLEQEMQQAHAEEGLNFAMAPFQDAPAAGGLTHVQTAVGRQANAGAAPAQERHVWRGQTGNIRVFAESVHFAREAAPEEWAVCKRAFEIVTQNLSVKA